MKSYSFCFKIITELRWEGGPRWWMKRIRRISTLRRAGMIWTFPPGKVIIQQSLFHLFYLCINTYIIVHTFPTFFFVLSSPHLDSSFILGFSIAHLLTVSYHLHLLGHPRNLLSGTLTYAHNIVSLICPDFILAFFNFNSYIIFWFCIYPFLLIF
jgi:hypothetical protein